MLFRSQIVKRNVPNAKFIGNVAAGKQRENIEAILERQKEKKERYYVRTQDLRSQRSGRAVCEERCSHFRFYTRRRAGDVKTRRNRKSCGNCGIWQGRGACQGESGITHQTQQGTERLSHQEYNREDTRRLRKRKHGR